MRFVDGLDRRMRLLARWCAIFLFPVLGLIIAPIVAWPIAHGVRWLFLNYGQPMSGKVFLGSVLVPLIGAIYAIAFVYGSAAMAPRRKKEIALVFYLVGVLISYAALWEFPNPSSSPMAEPLWQPFWLTLAAASCVLIVSLGLLPGTIGTGRGVGKRD